jgi:hypothetical protein
VGYLEGIHGKDVHAHDICDIERGYARNLGFGTIHHLDNLGLWLQEVVLRCLNRHRCGHKQCTFFAWLLPRL